MRNKFLWLFAIHTCLLFACSKNNVVYDHSINIPHTGWNKDSLSYFTFKAPDSLHTYTIHVTITNNDSYAYANVFLFSSIRFPDNKLARDTIEFMVADRKGNWTGKGRKSHTNTYIFKNNIRFPESGIYTFSFEQAMRCSNSECNLYGIESIGMQIIEN